MEENVSYNFVKDIRKGVESLQLREKIIFLELLENRDINTTKAKKCAKMTDKLKIYSKKQTNKTNKKNILQQKNYTRNKQKNIIY